MKTCSYCKTEKPESEFQKHSLTKDGLQSWCRECKRLFGNKHRNTKIFRMNEYKREKGCLLCEENDPVALVFHHINPEEKSFTISEFTHHKWMDILLEIKKCVVVCRNCHSKIHAHDSYRKLLIKQINIHISTYSTGKIGDVDI